jgi:hypothetical protein
MGKFNKRTDFNQKAIVNDLREMGVQCILTNFGQDYPDLMCGWRGTWTLLEVKGEASIDRGQLRFIANSKGPIAVVTNTDEAIAAVKGATITDAGKLEVAKWLVRNATQASLSVNKFREVIG